MNIRSIIVNDVGMPCITSKMSEIQSLFNELTYTHLPIHDDGLYVGSISENDARSFDPLKSLEEFQYALEGFYVRDTDNWLDALHTFSKNETNIMPVLDEENKYLGYLELHEVIQFFTEAPFLNSPGGILVVEKGYKDFSFSEISQIVESNGAHVLGAFVSSIENDLAQITVKTGPASYNSILQSFRRYGYHIISSQMEDSMSSNLEERSRYLDKYLNM